MSILSNEQSWSRPDSNGRRFEYDTERSSNVPMTTAANDRDITTASAYDGSGSHRREAIDDAPASISLSGSEPMTVEEQQWLQVFVQELEKRHEIHKKRADLLREEIETKMQRLHEQQRRLAELDNEEQELHEALQYAAEFGIHNQLDQLRGARVSAQNAQDRLHLASMKLDERSKFLGQNQTKIDQFRRQLDELREGRGYRSMMIRQALLADVNHNHT
ncbi:hypothetical protein BDF22DRAFT_651880 [Syncephalis plumigaleata]|nr:hypothetical protein BDF22DRAFT_651880 [Syncephalis plumigaleata]